MDLDEKGGTRNYARHVRGTSCLTAQGLWPALRHARGSRPTGGLRAIATSPMTYSLSAGDEKDGINKAKRFY